MGKIDVYKEWRTLKDKPIVNKEQPFEWMNHLTNEEIDEWVTTIDDPFKAMIDTNILYEVSKVKQR
jgi:hypothetical protein